MNAIIYAISRDKHWLDAISRIADSSIVVITIECSNAYPECLESVAEDQPRSLLLLDATGQTNLRESVVELRDLGWRYVIVVAADQSSSEARAVLQSGLAYDYQKKSYAVGVIRRSISQTLREIDRDLRR